MNDKEIRDYAKQVIREAFDELNIELPDFVEKKEDNEGNIFFLLNISDESYGAANIFYNPLTAVQAIIKESISQLSEDEQAKLPTGSISKPINRIDFDIRSRTYFLLGNFSVEFAEVVYAQPKLSKYFRYFGLGKIEKFKSITHERKSTLAEVEKEADDIISHFGEGRKKRLLDEFYTRVDLVKPPKIMFAWLYESTRKEWEKAKKIYKKIKDSEKSWVMVIKSQYPNFDEDLISRFDHEENAISMPSQIALIYTARILQLPEESASLRTLNNILTESRKHLSSKSDSEIEKEVKEFLKHTNMLRNVVRSILQEN